MPVLDLRQWIKLCYINTKYGSRHVMSSTVLNNTGNVCINRTLRHIRITTVAMQKLQLSHIPSARNPINVLRYSSKVPLSFSDFNETGNFLKFFNNSQIQNFTKIRSVWAELFHAEGGTDEQTDKTMLFAILQMCLHQEASEVSSTWTCRRRRFCWRNFSNDIREGVH